MAQLFLMQSQKNEVLELIKDAGLEPFNFKWTTINSDKTPSLYVHLLRYLDSDFYFLFDYRLGSDYAIYSPGMQKMVEEEFPGDWDNQKGRVTKWLFCLSREINQPDLWSEIAKYQIPSGMEVKPDTSEEQFTIPQVERIIQGLQQIKSYLEKERLITKEHSGFVEEKLSYLEEATKRQGRRDWIHTAIGALVTICAALTLSPEQGRVLFNLLKSTVTGIIQFLPVK